MADITILPWQSATWERLSAYHRSGRLPHALLLVGPRGVGKTIIARCLARTLLCEQPDTGDICTCPACRRFLAGSHPDFMWIRPGSSIDVLDEDSAVEESETATPRPKGKKGSTHILIDQIRALGEWSTLKAHYGRYKIALLTPAEQMNINAANSLLKTLEAPPGETLLMLATAHPAQLPATVRSRCQTVTLPPVAAPSAVPWLLAQGIKNLNSATLLLTLAEGGPLIALELARNGKLEQRMTLFAELEGVIMGRLAPVVVAQSWLAHEIERVIDFQWSWTADMIRSLAQSTDLINPDLTLRLTAIAQRLGIRHLYVMLDHLTAALRLVRGPTNPNLQLLLEDMLITWRA